MKEVHPVPDVAVQSPDGDGHKGAAQPSAPRRVQLSRAKGWRMPPNTVKVDRSTRWGNPVVVGEPHPYCTPSEIAEGHECARPMTAEDAVAIFRTLLFSEEGLAPLRGKNLACWCKPGAPCHADVLLELANRETPPPADAAPQARTHSASRDEPPTHQRGKSTR